MWYEVMDVLGWYLGDVLSVIGAILLVIGALDCFLGYKIQKVITMIQTLVIMLILSFTVTTANFVSDSSIHSGIVFLLMLILTVVICYCVYRFFTVSVFVSVFLTVTIVGTLLCGGCAESDAPLFLSMILGAMLGLVAAKFYRMAIILSTSIRGGVCCAAALPMVAGTVSDVAFVIIASAVLALAGIFVQCKTNKKAVKDKKRNEGKEEAEQKAQAEKLVETQKMEECADMAAEKKMEDRQAAEMGQEEQKNFARTKKVTEPQLSVKMPDTEKLQKAGTAGAAAVMAWGRLFFSMNNGKDLMVKLTRYAQHLMIVLLVFSMAQHIWGWSYYAVQLVPFGAALALLAAKDNKYGVTTVAFAVWSVSSFGTWLDMISYYFAASDLLYLLAAVVYALIAAFAGVHWRAQRAAKRNGAAEYEAEQDKKAVLF